jgi:uncharacterized protein with FMN-binding domain
MPIRRRTRRAVLLVDLLMALVVLSVTFLMTLAMVPYSFQANQQAQLHSVGLKLAQQEMERVIYSGFNNVRGYTTTPQMSEQIDGAPQDVQFVTTVNPALVAGTSAQIYQIDVSCQWTYASRTVTESIETLLYQS